MKTLLTINDNNDFEPQDYTVRKVVRVIMLSEDGTKVLFFGHTLPGGGVEEGETDEQALRREAMEEIGAHIEIIQPVGEVVAYRDFLSKKYIIRGYLCRQTGEFVTPTSIDSGEQGTKMEWFYIRDAIKRLETELDSLVSQTPRPFQDDLSQRRIHHRRMSLAFLNEILTLSE